MRDSRKRKVKDSDGKEYIFQLRRLQCSACGKLHAEVPNIMQPQKHYGKSVIDSVLRDQCDYCAADDSTIYRWKQKNNTPVLHGCAFGLVVFFCMKGGRKHAK